MMVGIKHICAWDMIREGLYRCRLVWPDGNRCSSFTADPWTSQYYETKYIIEENASDLSPYESIIDVSPLPQGICANKDNHSPHLHNSDTLGVFWCHADQARRLPFAAERRRSEVQEPKLPARAPHAQ